MEKRQQAILEGIAENPVEWDCSLAPYTSFGIGGNAEALVRVKSCEELRQLLAFFSEHTVSWRFIGKGSNLLVSDDGFKGVVLLFGKKLSQIELLDTASSSEGIRIRVGAGCSMARLLNWCAEKGYTGLEFAAGIPGSLGGAVVMNAGACGGEIADRIFSLRTLSLCSGVEVLRREQLDFQYRLWKNQGEGEARRIVMSVDICLRAGDTASIQKECRINIVKRREKQPKVLKNAGSFFKNPQGDSAGRLIETSGLKGCSCGDAMVSPVHANFIVNTGKATAVDVCKLMDIVTTRVEKDSGVLLVPEVHFL